MSDSDTTQVAVACQGGGSHAAFTAGVLARLLPELDRRDEFSINGLSGASGGAVNAVAAWYGLHPETDETVEEVLDSIWRDVSARSFPDLVANWTGVWATTMQSMGMALPRFGPNDGLQYLSRAAQSRMRRTLERHVTFSDFPDLFDDSTPDLFVSTVDVLTGEHETFKNEDVTASVVVASSAVPSLFPAVRLPDGSYHWDGLFSHNPPIRRFLDDPGERERKPDEIWIVQINPTDRKRLPRTLPEIEDRRNELSGNLSLRQERDFIERVTEWVRAAESGEETGGRLFGPYKEVTVRDLSMPDDVAERLGVPSKLNRSPSHLKRLQRTGEDVADAFLEAL